jgi:hypothetical protein
MFALWGFAVATAYVPGIYSAPYMPRYWVIALGLAACARLDLKALDEKLLWCMGVLLLWSALTLLWTPALYGGALSVAFMAIFCLIVIASASATASQRNAVLSGFAVGMAVSTVLAVGQRLFGLTWIPQGAVPGGLFFNCEVLGETLAPVAVWCAIVSRERNDNGAVNFWPILAAIVLSVGVLLTQERIAIAVLAVGLTYGLVCDWRVRSAIFGLIGVVGIIAVVEHGALSADTRIMYWGTAIRSFTFFGSGIGWWFQAHPFPHEEYVHSDVLQSVVEIGFAAAALVALPVLAFWNGGSRAERAACVALCIEAVVSFPLHMPATLFVFAVLTGALCSRRADVRVSGLSRREDHADGDRQQAAYGGRILGSLRRGGALVPVRSAFAQYADHDPKPCEGIG